MSERRCVFFVNADKIISRPAHNSNYLLLESLISFCRESRCGEMADAQDLKSWDHKKSCGFESRHRHQFYLADFQQDGATKKQVPAKVPAKSLSG
jgi:hypothetical protein